MRVMKKRSNEPELMDLGPQYYTLDEYNDCLCKLGAIGRVLGGDRAGLTAFAQLPSEPESILDVGCGNGAFTLQLALRYPAARVIGSDISVDAIEAANACKKLYENKHAITVSNLEFQHRTSPELTEPAKSFDVVTATLVCHHLTDNQLVSFFQSAKKIASRAIIINDLQRSRWAYALFWLISPLFNNRLIRYDGLISIRRGFKRAELVALLRAAGFGSQIFTIQWRWAFRWLITIETS